MAEIKTINKTDAKPKTNAWKKFWKSPLTEKMTCMGALGGAGMVTGLSTTGLAMAARVIRSSGPLGHILPDPKFKALIDNIGRTGLTCAAVGGAVMIIGLMGPEILADLSFTKKAKKNRKIWAI